jgi:hypothetical protein
MATKRETGAWKYGRHPVTGHINTETLSSRLRLDERLANLLSEETIVAKSEGNGNRMKCGRIFYGRLWL